ncbi:MAG: macrolide-specific efflux protein MacA [Rhodospirillaceae bacterium]|nr:MAG: macrolide-specific efflux protein MacA [Rhodospirillaceae bacterium]
MTVVHLPASSSSKSLRYRFLFWGAAVILAAVFAAGGFLSQTRNDSDFALTVAVRGDIEDTTTALGTLQPQNYVDVGTQVSGQLRKIHVQIGDKVVEGQLLAEIDPTIHAFKVEASQAQLQALRAQSSEKQAQLTLARAQFDRQNHLLETSATSQEAYQRAHAALKSAEAQAEQLSAQIRQIESTLRSEMANLAYTRILAPMSGTVVSQTTRRGQTLNASQQAPTILRIADLRTMTAWTQVSEADVVKLKPGMDVYFTTLGQPARKRWGILRQILPTPEVVNNVVLYNALFDVENPDGDLAIQMSAQVFFVHAATRDAILVPASALSPGGQGGRDDPMIVLVMENGKPAPRPVRTGVRNRIRVQILSGLAAGETVVVGQSRPKEPRHTKQTFGHGRARLP